ncbi:MAG: RNA polymerase sigma factor RpoD/SigA [Candidatus Latescibacteria bacterium]|nr:RNA polymerase sigma factor RpoD/SigA [Candidatus Latescibacterota bacterium]
MDVDTTNVPEPLDRSLIRYMKEIADSSPLASTEEAELARRIRMGDVEARNRLVHANLRFVVSIALGYRHRGLSLGELISAGNVGLITAAERFDETQGYRFISYAVWWVRQAILQTLMEQRTVRMPVNRFDLLARISKSFSGLQQRLYADPAADDIAADLGVTLKDVERTLLASRSSLSLDAPFDTESGNSLLQTLADPAQASLDENLDKERMQQDISEVLDTLNERESDILRLYFGLEDGEGKTLEQIGEHLGITRERVRQIKETAIQKLRHAPRARRLKPYLETVS